MPRTVHLLFAGMLGFALHLAVLPRVIHGRWGLDLPHYSTWPWWAFITVPASLACLVAGWALTRRTLRAQRDKDPDPMSPGERRGL